MTQERDAKAEKTALLLRGMKSRFIGERLKAERAMEEIGGDAVEGLLAVIRRENGKRLLRRRIYMGVVTLFCTTFLPAGLWCLYMTISLAMRHDSAAGAYGGAIGALLGGGGGSLLGGFSWLLAPTQLQLLASSAITQIKDKKAVGALALAMDSGSRMRSNPTFETRIAAARGLVNILPTLGPEDAGLLDRDQRECLHRALLNNSANHDAEFIIPIIRALVRIGDTSAIASLERLAGIDARKPNVVAVKAEAEAALLSLRKILADQQAPEVLLRPSASAGESLLRVAQGSAESEPALLLRPTSEDAA